MPRCHHCGARITADDWPVVAPLGPEATDHGTFCDEACVTAYRNRSFSPIGE